MLNAAASASYVIDIADVDIMDAKWLAFDAAAAAAVLDVAGPVFFGRERFAGGAGGGAFCIICCDEEEDDPALAGVSTLMEEDAADAVAFTRLRFLGIAESTVVVIAEDEEEFPTTNDSGCCQPRVGAIIISGASSSF